MLKKIQQYLLLNYPLLWNIKVVPAFVGALAINILFFFAGYALTKIDFADRYSYSESFAGDALIYMGAIVTSILLFIIWLVSYSKNNAFKSFYPKSSGGLYLEWFLSFVIIAGFVFFPFSYYEGSVVKVRSYASKQDMIKAVETLNMVKILIPTSKTDYYQEYPAELSSNYAVSPAPDTSSEYSDTTPATDYVDPVEYAESHNVQYPDYPDFAQLSLLNYNSTYEFYISERYNFTVRDNDVVKKWLKDKNKEEISKLMDDFLALQNKHNLSTNLTKDQWMNLVYNPSKYPVGDFNLITPYNYVEEEAKNNYSSYYNTEGRTTGYYLSYDELKQAYDKIMDAHCDNEANVGLLIISICVALSISLFVFSFRSTSGKAWLIALVSIGLILFINGVISFAISAPFDMEIGGPLFYITVLLAICFLELVSVLRKSMYRKAKGKSDIYMNHLVWFIPAVPALIFIAIYIIGHNQYHYSDTDYNYGNNSLYETYHFMDEHIVEFIWGNICLTFVSMWFFIQLIVRKWKSLPEQ